MHGEVSVQNYAPQTMYDGLRGRRILVTGGSGFIGLHLCRRLSNLDVEVYAVWRSATEGRYGSVVYLPGDLIDFEITKRIFREIKPDIVFNLAGVAAGSRDPALVLPTFQNNLLTTVNLLLAAQEIGVSRLVLPGSLEEPEDAIVSPSSPYAASKWAASAYGRLFQNIFNVPVTIARIFMAYGPTTRDMHKLIPYVVLSLLRGEAPKISSGQREVDWIYVDDVVEGLLTLAVADNAPGNTIDIGSGRLVSIRALVENLVTVMESPISPSFGSLPERPFEQVRVADVSRTFGLVGWEPQVALDEGLRRTVAWFKRWYFGGEP